MAGAYSTDLRERVLTAVEAGELPAAVAERFTIGRASVYRWVAAAGADEGRRAAKRLGGGRKPLIRGAVEAALSRLLEANNHLRLVEGRDRLAEATGMRVDRWTVGRGSKLAERFHPAMPDGTFGKTRDCAGWTGRERSAASSLLSATRIEASRSQPIVPGARHVGLLLRTVR